MRVPPIASYYKTQKQQDLFVLKVLLNFLCRSKKIVKYFPMHFLTAQILTFAGAAKRTAIPVTALEIGDEVMLKVQGGARHTGIEIQEFIIEK